MPQSMSHRRSCNGVRDNGAQPVRRHGRLASGAPLARRRSRPTLERKAIAMDRGMQFEITMRLLFGEKAYQIAGIEANPKHRREWLQKAVRELLRLVNALDTTPRHKKMLMAELEAVSRALKGAAEPSWEVVYRLFRLCMRLFGFDYVAGARCHTPAYWQTPDQRHTERILDGDDPMRGYEEEKDAVSIRRDVVEELRKKGLDDFKISLVLNTSEYAIKQLRSNLLVRPTRRKRRAADQAR